MKLITMTDFIVGSNEIVNTADCCKVAKFYSNYAIFLKTDLELGMFIPCDENGKPMPTLKEMETNTDSYYPSNVKDYIELLQEAKDRVMFEGEIHYSDIHPDKYLFIDETCIMAKIKNKEWQPILSRTIEDLTLYFDLTLTPNAIKQLK